MSSHAISWLFPTTRPEHAANDSTLSALSQPIRANELLVVKSTAVTREDPLTPEQMSSIATDTWLLASKGLFNTPFCIYLGALAVHITGRDEVEARVGVRL